MLCEERRWEGGRESVRIFLTGFLPSPDGREGSCGTKPVPASEPCSPSAGRLGMEGWQRRALPLGCCGLRFWGGQKEGGEVGVRPTTASGDTTCRSSWQSQMLNPKQQCAYRIFPSRICEATNLVGRLCAAAWMGFQDLVLNSQKFADWSAPDLSVLP